MLTSLIVLNVLLIYIVVLFDHDSLFMVALPWAICMIYLDSYICISYLDPIHSVSARIV